MSTPPYIQAALMAAQRDPLMPAVPHGAAVPRSYAVPPDTRLRDAIREGTAATLAAGIIAANGADVPAEEAVAIMQHVHSILYPPQAPDDLIV